MRATVTPTNEVVIKDGAVVARVWRGVTEQGARFELHVAAVVPDVGYEAAIADGLATLLRPFEVKVRA